MSDHQSYPGEADGQVTTTMEHGTPNDKNGRDEERNDPVARISANFLDNGDSVIYAIVGLCFLAGGLIALGYAFWDFGSHLLDLSTFLDAKTLQPADLARPIMQFVSD